MLALSPTQNDSAISGSIDYEPPVIPVTQEQEDSNESSQSSEAVTISIFMGLLALFYFLNLSIEPFGPVVTWWIGIVTLFLILITGAMLAHIIKRIQLENRINMMDRAMRNVEKKNGRRLSKRINVTTIVK